MSIAARLQQLGVDTLIVDRHERIGDNWRKRYHSLTLHNEVHVNHLPYLPFPPTFPVYIPKDKLANWFEFYVEAMELNFWTGTALAAGSYDDARKQWNVTLKRSDGSERVMHPRHLIFATGVSSIPVTPDLPGLDDFAGTVVHSGDFKNAEHWKGRKALVLGSGTSGHDVAQELQRARRRRHHHPAQQDLCGEPEGSAKRLRHLFRRHSVRRLRPAGDLVSLSGAAARLPALHRQGPHGRPQADRARSKQRGFKIWYGEDETGFQMMYLRYGGGYYFNVGCSELIISGKVKLLQFADIDRFVADGARLRDGSVVPAELLVLATGYKNQQDTVRAYLGDDIADKIGPVWGFDEGGELRNMWRRTAQQGLWFTAGSLAQCRIFSRYLAIQIKALEEGLVD